MGVVYSAYDTVLERKVAIKVVGDRVLADKPARELLLHEARAASALNHPNICTIHQVGDSDGEAFIVMEQVEGQPLSSVVGTGGLSPDLVIRYGMQIADALAHAHKHGVIHRDLKSTNVLVTPEGRVKVLDFGLATRLPPAKLQEEVSAKVPLTESSMIVGTLPYLAPELLRAEPADARTDIWALGILLYEMASGTHPFHGRTAFELSSAILRDPPTPLPTSVPLGLGVVILRCLEKPPVDRYQRASEVHSALEALRGSPVLLRGHTVKKAPVARWLPVVKKHKWGLAAGLVLAGLLLGEVLHSTHSLHSTNLSQATITHKQFTFSGNAYEPAISPDGLFVAYVSRKPNQEQTLMVQASNGTQLELARGAVITYPRWSTDGSEVLFYRLSYGVSVVSRLGGVVRTISRGFHACWFAPDGSQVVTASTDSGFKGFRLVNNLTGEVKEVRLSEYTWLLDVDCSARAGLILAVTNTSERFQIRVFKPDGSEEQQLVEDNDQIYAARWSPAGDYIYYLHGKGSTQELSKLSVNRKHAEPAVLANGLQTGGFFTLSADGSRLAYTREDHPSNLWRVALPTTGKRAKVEISPLTSGTSYYGAPSFSPDGRSIAYASGPNPDEANIFKMQVAGGERTQLTFFEHATTASPAWSQDGQHIAFVSDQNGTPRVWTVSADGGTAQPRGNTNALDTSRKVAWWPSSNIVYQQPGNRNFLQINDKTLEEKILIQHDKSVGWVPGRPVFSPDGNKMAVFWNREDRGLWIISLEPYSETLLLSGAINPFGWSPDGKHVYAIRGGAGESREVIRVQVDTPNEATPVATLPGDVVDNDGASVSPDGKEIFASVSEKKSDVWLMENFDPASTITHPIGK